MSPRFLPDDARDGRTRRARLAWAALALLALAPAFASASMQPIDGIGLIDYSSPPDFRVGTWAKYHIVGHSQMGMEDDYFVTVIIAGEEEFWGEKCFWVETHTEFPGKASRSLATLMSYDAFRDSLGWKKMPYYMRKTITGLTADGKPDIQIVRIPKGSVRSASKDPGYIYALDTLGVDTVSVPKGHFDVHVFKLRTGTQVQHDVADSTVEETEHEDRTTFHSKKVPITHLVRELIDHRDTRRSWLTGQSSHATPEFMFEHAIGDARLMDCGEGMEGIAVPKQFRRPLAEQAAASASTAPPKKTSAPPSKSTKSKGP